MILNPNWLETFIGQIQDLIGIFWVILSVQRDLNCQHWKYLHGGWSKKFNLSQKVSVHKEIYCDILRIFNTLFVFLDDGKIFSGIKYHLISIHFHIGIFWTLLQENSYPDITCICRNEFRGCTNSPIFGHRKLNNRAAILASLVFFMLRIYLFSIFFFKFRGRILFCMTQLFTSF